MKIKTSHLILAQGILMVVFLFVTAWFNRFSADDYFCIGELNNFSFFEIYKKLYLTWAGRWTLYFAILFLMQFSDYDYFLFAISSINFLMLFFSVFSVFKQLNIRFNTNFSSFSINVCVLIFIGIFFFFTHATGQSWYWISASLAYLWSCIFFMLGFSRWLKDKYRFLDYAIMIFSLIYIGGSNEVLALTSIVLLFVSFFLGKNKNTSFILLFTLCCSFSIYYFSSGTIRRDMITPSLSIIDLVLYVGYGTVKYLFIDFYKTILPAILFGVPFIVMGQTSTPLFNEKINIKKELIKSIGFILAVATFNQLVVIYALGGLAPDRATITTSLLGSFAIARFMFLYGNNLKEMKINFKPFLIIIVVFMLGFNIVFFFIHKEYSHSVDRRLDYILSNKNPVIEVTKLKNSGYLNTAEITSDTNHFLNQHGYSLN